MQSPNRRQQFQRLPSNPEYLSDKTLSYLDDLAEGDEPLLRTYSAREKPSEIEDSLLAAEIEALKRRHAARPKSPMVNTPNSSEATLPQSWSLVIPSVHHESSTYSSKPPQSDALYEDAYGAHFQQEDTLPPRPARRPPSRPTSRPESPIQTVSSSSEHSPEPLYTNRESNPNGNLNSPPSRLQAAPAVDPKREELEHAHLGVLLERKAYLAKLREIEAFIVERGCCMPDGAPSPFLAAVRDILLQDSDSFELRDHAFQDDSAEM
jgi:hypothetical protein